MTFTPPLISAATAGFLIIMQTVLMMTVVTARRRNRQSLGDGGHHDLLVAVRRHGNFAENAALFLVGFTLLELAGGGRICPRGAVQSPSCWGASATPSGSRCRKPSIGFASPASC